MKEVSSAQVVGVGFDTARRRLSDNLLFLRQEFDFQLLDNRVRDLVLNDEDIGQVPIIPIGPKVAVILCINELSRDPHTRAGLADTSFHNEINAEALRD